MKLNQVVALVNGKKSRFQSSITELYHRLQKTDLVSGFSRAYQPKDDDGEVFHPEVKRVQDSVHSIIKSAAEEFTDVMGIVGTQDTANTLAKAEVKVGGVSVADVPVTHLLFMEKRFVDMRSMIEQLPVLDPSEEWTKDPARDVYTTGAVITTKTKKITKPIVKYDATPEHPAQTELITEDVTVGHWSTTKFSSAIPVDEKRQLLVKVNDVIDSIKKARENANELKVESVNYGASLVDYVFNGT